MDKKKVIFAMALSAMLVACGSEPSTVEEAMEGVNNDTIPEKVILRDEHNSQNSLDWEGVYSGVLPCEGCEGVKTELTLKKSNKYEVTETYLGKGDSVKVTAGEFKWDETGSKLVLSGNEKQFKVGENILFSLDQDGKKIISKTSDKYILQKKSLKLEDAKWELVEFMGESITDSITKIYPTIEFDADEKRAFGTTSCNHFSSSYNSDGQFVLSFEKTIATKKGCIDANMENEFLNFLDQVDSYIIAGNYLILRKGDSAPLAKFKMI